MITIGRLCRSITIQKKIGTYDSYGQEVLEFVDIATVWANVKPVTGREKLRAGAYDSTLSHTVAVRYQPELLPETAADAWRILYGTRILEITAAQDMDDARKFILFDCTETGVV